MRRLFSILPALAAMALVIVYSLQAVELGKVHAQLDQREQHQKELATRSPRNVHHGKTVASHRKNMTQVSSGGDSNGNQQVGSFTSSSSNAVRAKVAAFLKEMQQRLQNDPAVRRLAHAQTAKMVNKDYADLFKYLKISPADADKLSQLLQGKYNLDVDLFLDLSNSGYNNAQRQALIRDAREARFRIEEQIAAILGTEDYTTYLDYVDTIPQRRELAGYKDKLFAAGIDLTWDQEDKLIRAMRENSQRGVTEEENPLLAEIGHLLPEERVGKATAEDIYIEQMKVQHERLLADAKSILTDDQYRLLQDYVTDQEKSSKLWADLMPSNETESNDRATVKVGGSQGTPAQPVSVIAATAAQVTWGDDAGGSSAKIYKTDGNTLGIHAEVSSGWGSGITFWPTGSAQNDDGSVNASGAQEIVARIKAPAGVTLRFGLLESGSGWSGAPDFTGAAGADGEAFRHEGIQTQDGWQTYTIPLSQLKLNGGYGNQKGNRTIDVQAIKGIEILIPGGQPNADLEIDSVRLQ